MAQPKSPNSTDLDSFDQAILGILQQNNGTTQRIIGEAVNLSAPAVQRRIRRLEEIGVIRANVAVVDPEKIGRAITLIVDVELVSERTELIDAAKQRFKEAPEVQQCYFVTGQADFVLILTVATMADYEALARRLFHSNENVKRFRTLVTMDRVKVGLDLPIG
jgi:DNA-binding Lrp family transcriptional regulator